jgi:uncharacterized protein
MLRLSAAAARLLHVAVQGLDRRQCHNPDRHAVLETVRRMGVLQIDTISVVARSPYFVLFSRLGAYEPRWLDELLAGGALFEYWAHEASLLPMEDYGLFRHRMLKPDTMGWKYRADWVAAHRHELDRVLTWIGEHGAVRSSDFAPRAGHQPGWWGWKPEKRALEYLLTAGELMVSRRQAFQRVYDLRERVHPSWSDELLPTAEEAERQLVLRAVHALGVALPQWVADYYRMSRRSTPGIVQDLVHDGELVEVHVTGWDGIAIMHPAHLDLADAAAADALPVTLTTLLSPFDPLVWDRERARVVFGFHYRLECYTPAAKRRFGYFVLPLLRRGELVGRADIKAHRRAGVFEVKALYLEAGVIPSASLVSDIAGALRDAAVWHVTPDVQIRRTLPASLHGPLASAVKTGAG